MGKSVPRVFAQDRGTCREYMNAPDSKVCNVFFAGVCLG